MNTALVVVIAIVLAGCFCVGLCGLLFAFGPDILHELGLYSWLPALTVLG